MRNEVYHFSDLTCFLFVNPDSMNIHLNTLFNYFDSTTTRLYDDLSWITFAIPAKLTAS